MLAAMASHCADSAPAAGRLQEGQPQRKSGRKRARAVIGAGRGCVRRVMPPRAGAPGGAVERGAVNRAHLAATNLNELLA